MSLARKTAGHGGNPSPIPYFLTALPKNCGQEELVSNYLFSCPKAKLVWEKEQLKILELKNNHDIFFKTWLAARDELKRRQYN
ncbi:uncharacterized protein DS421_5g164180 [Arachis hypogaea]|nr:uncharacterized protein DS421_5g164180 [Arachis hypogaea]